MKITDITNILLNLILLTYFIYFNVTYILPIFKKKTEHFDHNETNLENDLEILEDKIKNTINIEELKTNNGLLETYRNKYKTLKKVKNN